jgi:tRNA acetyltransferase TAN1
MVTRDFNLIISTPRGHENDACSPIVKKSGVSGLIVAKTVLSTFKVIEDLRKMLKERPCEFRHTLRVIPVEVVVHTRLEEIRKASLKISSKIRDFETFRVTVEKRRTGLETREIIKVVAEDIDNKVDLDNPDKILLVEVLGGLTGVSVIKPRDIISVVKEKLH